MSRFKGVKPGDYIEVETASESGVALVEAITEKGVVYTPVTSAWQKGRLHRDPATARQIKGVYRKLRSVSA